MPPEQSLVVPLKGFGAFKRVITSGKRFEKNSVKAFVCLSKTNKPSIFVGFTTTKRVKIAAHRNHLKRLMREAFRIREKDFIQHSDLGIKIEIVFLFNNAKSAPKMVQISSVDIAIKHICQAIKSIHLE